MKNISLFAYLFAIASLLSACGGGEEPQTKEAKKMKLDELRKESADLQVKISKLETELSKEGVEIANPFKKVEVKTVDLKDFAHYVEVQGNVLSDQNVEIRPELSGVVLKRNVEVGQYVKKGQTLIVIDAEQIRRNVAEVQKQLELAEIVFNRQKNLWDENIGSEIQYLEAKNRKESLDKKLETLNTQLSKAYVKSPISGYVDQFFINAGEMAMPQMPIARVINVDKVQIEAGISESYVRSVRKGDTAWVDFPTVGYQTKLPIKVVGQFINPSNRTFRIEMKADNKEGWLKPNTVAVVKVKDFEALDAVVVPTYLVQQSTGGEYFLYVVKKDGADHVVKKLNIVPGKSYKGETLVESGLKAGEILLTKGYSEVTDGQKVSVVSAKSKTLAHNK